VGGFAKVASFGVGVLFTTPSERTAGSARGATAFGSAALFSFVVFPFSGDVRF
jgi:hypothetical protein